MARNPAKSITMTFRSTPNQRDTQAPSVIRASHEASVCGLPHHSMRNYNGYIQLRSLINFPGDILGYLRSDPRRRPVPRFAHVEIRPHKQQVAILEPDQVALSGARMLWDCRHDVVAECLLLEVNVFGANLYVCDSFWENNTIDVHVMLRLRRRNIRSTDWIWESRRSEGDPHQRHRLRGEVYCRATPRKSVRTHPPR